MFSKREKQILTLLLDNNFKKELKNFIDYLKVSKRTLQYDIQNINYYLKKENLNEIKLKKDEFIFIKENIQNMLLSKYDKTDLTKDDRIDLIYLYSIFSKNGLNISTLANDIGISRNTLKADMNKIQYDFIYNKGYFLKLDLSTKSNILLKIISNNNISNFSYNIIDFNLLDNIKEFVRNVANNIDLKLTDNIYNNIYTYIYCIMEYSTDNDICSFNSSKEYKIIKKIYQEHFNNINKLNKVVDFLIGMSLTPNIESWSNESFLLGKLIKQVSLEIEQDLTKDDIFYSFLLSHIKTSIYRLKNGISLNTTPYKDLINKDDELKYILKKALIEMENIFDITFTDLEISLLVFHFRAAIERKNNGNRKKVILVCGMGYGSSKVLEQNLKENFDIDIVDVLPVHLVKNNKAINKNIDYILTTSDIDIPAIKINPLILEDDYKKLISLGIKIKKKKILVDDIVKDIEKDFGINKTNLKSYLLDKYPENFYTSNVKYANLLKALSKNKVLFLDKVKDYKEAITKTGEILLKNKAIKNEYIDKMISNVEKLGPYIVIENGVAIPHSNENNLVFKTDIALLILKQEVKFNKNKKASVFFSFASKDNKSHIKLLNEFYNLIINKNFLTYLKNISTFEELYNYIEKIEEE